MTTTVALGCSGLGCSGRRADLSARDRGLRGEQRYGHLTEEGSPTPDRGRAVVYRHDELPELLHVYLPHGDLCGRRGGRSLGTVHSNSGDEVQGGVGHEPQLQQPWKQAYVVRRGAGNQP